MRTSRGHDSSKWFSAGSHGRFLVLALLAGAIVFPGAKQAHASPTLNFGRGPAFLAAGPLNVAAVYDVPMGTTPTLTFSGAGASRFHVNSATHPLANTYVFSLAVDTTATAQPGDAYTATASDGKSIGGTTQPSVTSGGIVDNVAPPAPSLTFDGPTAWVAAGAHTLTAVYGEPMGTTPNLAFDGPGGGHFATSSTAQPAPDTYVFTVTVDATLTSQGGEGYVLAVTAGRDLTGNVQSSPTTLSGVVDNNAPGEPSLGFSRDPGRLTSGPLTITAAYAEPMGTTPSLVFSRDRVMPPGPSREPCLEAEPHGFGPWIAARRPVMRMLRVGLQRGTD
ncbi:MAG: hypothetical protein HY303_04255, partial [Candidatus Wallbacteria bacterium]|nr:hypothetical protein [Candidatus Wallbacteria bacterium]